MKRTRFHIKAMDCPSEEQLVRSALASAAGVVRLEFDLAERRLTVWHGGEVKSLEALLAPLGLGAELMGSDVAADHEITSQSASSGEERSVLRVLLGINAVMFVVELVAGWLGESTGLLSDSLDMLADALVYGVALWAVGRAPAAQRYAARMSGWFQLLLALGVLGEVLRRAALGSAPESQLMMGTALLALVANVTCLVLLTKHRSGGVHMRASWIFSTNDVIANLGVIAAGVLVSWTSSAIPDLVIGALIGAVVLRGAIRILKLARPPSGG